MTGIELAAKIIEDADAIERTKHGRALTLDEARTVKAAAFLLKILPPSHMPALKEDTTDTL